MSETSGGLPLMAQTQNSRYLTFNELAWALNVLQTGVLDRDLTSPPGSPSEGDAYIVDSPATGAWAGHENDIAFFFDGLWNFLQPDLAQGNGLYVIDEGLRVRWSDGSPTGYEVLSVGSDASSIAYTPTTPADWDGSADPGNANNAFDQLAERVTDLEAGSGTSAGRHAIYIAAGSMTPSFTGGCASLSTIASAANQPDIQTLDFDPSTQEYAQFSIRMPKSWDEGTVTFVPIWSHAATVTNFGVVWDLQGVAISDDDAIAVNFGTAQTSTDTGGTTNDVYIGPESAAITIAGSPASEDVVCFRVSRVTGNGSDTMAIDARLRGITLYITTNAETDA